MTSSLANETLVRVQYRFVLGESGSPGTSRLFFVYVSKWSTLMKRVLSYRSDMIYDDLPSMRKLITKDTKVVDLLKYSDYFNSEDLNLLISAQPLFNISPVDLKVYVLAVFGLRSYHINKLESN